MKKQNWKKNKKSTASLRNILFMLSKDLPSLADDLIGTWEGAANFANDVAESIIQSKPLRVPLNTGRCEDFQKYEVLGERGWVYLLPPYDFDMLAYHSPLMDHLDEVMEMRLRAVASKYDAAWAKIYAVIGCRFPSLIAECNEVERHRVELHNIVADLYLGERSAATGLTNFRMRWYDAVTGRWLSKDPIGLSGGLNLYAFCGSDPINQTDWIGLCSDEEDSFWEDYFELASEWMVDTSSIVPALTIGPWPKHLSPATGGRGPGLGSSNPLTSVPRAFGGDSIGLGPFLRSGPFRGGVAAVAVSIVGVGCWNFGVAIGALVGAMF